AMADDPVHERLPRARAECGAFPDLQALGRPPCTGGGHRSRAAPRLERRALDARAVAARTGGAPAGLPPLDLQAPPVPRAEEGLGHSIHDLSRSPPDAAFPAAASRRRSAASSTRPSQPASTDAATRARARVFASMEA